METEDLVTRLQSAPSSNQVNVSQQQPPKCCCCKFPVAHEECFHSLLSSILDTYNKKQMIWKLEVVKNGSQVLILWAYAINWVTVSSIGMYMDASYKYKNYAFMELTREKSKEKTFFSRFSQIFEDIHHLQMTWISRIDIFFCRQQMDKTNYFTHAKLVLSCISLPTTGSDWLKARGSIDCTGSGQHSSMWIASQSCEQNG